MNRYMWVLTVMDYEVLAAGPFVFDNHYQAREYAEQHFGVPPSGWLDQREKHNQWWGEAEDGNVVEVVQAEYNPL